MIPYRMNPLGISMNEILPLTLTALSAGSTVTLNANGSPTVSGLHYRLGKSGTWLSYTPGSTITLAAVGDSVQFWNSAETLSSSAVNYVKFAMNGQISAKGNVQSLLNWIDYCKSLCFHRLFEDCSAMVTPPDFPALTLDTSCYNRTFTGCSGLTALPYLPASVLAVNCYYQFCNGCSSITQAIIKGTGTLPSQSCRRMFYGCSALNRIEVNFTNWNGANNATTEWVSGVAASGTFIKPTALPEEYGVDRIPTGWTVVNK